MYNDFESKCKVFINETEIIGPVAFFMSCSVFTVGLRCQGIPKKSLLTFANGFDNYLIRVSIQKLQSGLSTTFLPQCFSISCLFSISTH